MQNETLTGLTTEELQPQNYYDVYRGDIIHKFSLYLYKYYEELFQSFNIRARRSRWFGDNKKVVDVYRAYVTTPAPRIEPEESPNWSMMELFKRATLHCLIAGWGYIIVLAEKPQFYNRLEFTETKDGIRTNTKPMLEISFKDETIKNKETGTTEEFKPEQAIKVFWNEEKDPLIKDTARTEIENYNNETLIGLLKRIGVSINLSGPEFDKDKKPKPGKYLDRKSKDDPDYKWIIPDIGPLLKIMREEVYNLRADIAIAHGLQQEFADIEQIRIMTGKSKQVSMTYTNATVQGIAFHISKACNKAGQVWADLTGTTPVQITAKPEIRQITDDEKQEQLGVLMDRVPVKEAIVRIQTEMYKTQFFNDPPNELKKIIEAIKKDGGKTLESGLFKSDQGEV